MGASGSAQSPYSDAYRLLWECSNFSSKIVDRMILVFEETVAYRMPGGSEKMFVSESTF